MQIEKRLCVENVLGLHIRVATTIVKMLESKKSDVFFSVGRLTVKADSVMSLVKLGAQYQTWIDVCVKGSDAQEVFDLLAKAFKNRFGESV